MEILVTTWMSNVSDNCSQGRELKPVDRENSVRNSRHDMDVANVSDNCKIVVLRYN
ncbi:MAG: hypothetical protein IJJ71_02120 [Treponema sp.]|uniref:hypothetical protein n=1 Tax=Treponema sp. TaxID=166 RepID=UPI0025E57880|nr:hypothetical protein [Treponema sp.]MBR0494955.1 hypothetical protein [Treponema sp.]